MPAPSARLYFFREIRPKSKKVKWRGHEHENSEASATNHVFIAQKLTSGKGLLWQNSISGKNGSKKGPIYILLFFNIFFHFFNRSEKSIFLWGYY